MSDVLKVGLIGLDALHAVAFTRLLNGVDGRSPAVEGGRVVAAWPGCAAADFAPSHTRIDEITGAVRDELGVPLVDSPTDLANRVDVVLMTSADPRTHPELLSTLAPAGKPVLIVKVLCTDAAAAAEMVETAKRHRLPLLCASPHRFSSPLRRALKTHVLRGEINGADLHGRMPHEPPLPPIFWYGTHLVDMLYAILGPGCRQITTIDADPTGDTVIVGAWDGGRVGVLRGSPHWPRTWSVRFHHGGQTTVVDPAHNGPEPNYADLLRQAISMSRTGVSPISSGEMVEVVRFAAAAEQSRVSGSTVRL